jgi:hypothetical protein
MADTMNYHRQQLPHRYYIICEIGPNDPSRPLYPLSYTGPIRASAGGRIISFFFILFALAAVGSLVYAGISYFGLDQIAQIYGFEHVIAALDVGAVSNF